MTPNAEIDPVIAVKILEFIREEREKALSAREWKHRIAGYGYGIKETSSGSFVTTLTDNAPVCALPAELCA